MQRRMIMSKRLSYGIARDVKKIRERYKASRPAFSALLNATPPTEIQITKENLRRYELNQAIPPANKYIKIMNMALNLKGGYQDEN